MAFTFVKSISSSLASLRTPGLAKALLEDIFSDLKTGSYFYSNGWQIKGIYSMIIGFIFAASTIWNVELRFLQSFAWLIGAFTSYITYYLLASD